MKALLHLLFSGLLLLGATSLMVGCELDEDDETTETSTSEEGGGTESASTEGTSDAAGCGGYVDCCLDLADFIGDTEKTTADCQMEVDDLIAAEADADAVCNEFCQSTGL